MERYGGRTTTNPGNAPGRILESCLRNFGTPETAQPVLEDADKLDGYSNMNGNLCSSTGSYESIMLKNH